MSAHQEPDGHEVVHVDTPEEIKKTLWKYYAVFGALMVFTIITVAASYLDLGRPGNITLAMIIATIKATLVALIFMHLSHERKVIYTFLAFTFFFFLGLFWLTFLAW